MKLSKKISLCGITSAFSAIFVILAGYLPTGKIALYALASLAFVIPLSKRLTLGTIMCYVAVSALAVIFTGYKALIFIVFFGLYPILLAIEQCLPEGRAVSVASLLVEFVIFNVALLILIFFIISLAGITLDLPFNVLPYWWLILIIGAPVFFIWNRFYRHLMGRMSDFIDKYFGNS